MKKVEIKEFFKAIRDNDVRKVSSLVASDHAYLSVCNFSPPKKDDGQSGLQVAFKCGNFDIARFLIDQGAAVNFIETSLVNEWTAPVLHDCIRAVIFNSYTLQKDQTRFDEGFALLQSMLERGANPNATDSYGNNCLHRAILDARQMIDHPGAGLSNGILLDQLRMVFAVLLAAGADPEIANENRPSAKSDLVTFRLEKYRLW